MKLATRLAPITLEDSASSQRVEFGTLWRDRTTLLVFLRHFG